MRIAIADKTAIHSASAIKVNFNPYVSMSDVIKEGIPKVDNPVTAEHMPIAKVSFEANQCSSIIAIGIIVPNPYPRPIKAAAKQYEKWDVDKPKSAKPKTINAPETAMPARRESLR